MSPFEELVLKREEALLQRVADAVSAGVASVNEAQIRQALTILVAALCRQQAIDVSKLLHDFNRIAEASIPKDKAVPISVLDVRAALSSAIKPKG